MKNFHIILKYLSEGCLVFLIYLVLSYFFPTLFDFVIVGVFHELLTLPVLFGSVLIFVYSFVCFFVKPNRKEVLTTLLISIVNVLIIGFFTIFAE